MPLRCPPPKSNTNVAPLLARVHLSHVGRSECVAAACLNRHHPAQRRGASPPSALLPLLSARPQPPAELHPDEAAAGRRPAARQRRQLEHRRALLGPLPAVCPFVLHLQGQNPRFLFWCRLAAIWPLLFHPVPSLLTTFCFKFSCAAEQSPSRLCHRAPPRLPAHPSLQV